MVVLTKSTGYGLLALQFLARQADKEQIYSAKVIVSAYDLPFAVFAKTLQRLARAGFVTSHPGLTGGYVLARCATKINALDVISVLDRALITASCNTDYALNESIECRIISEHLQRICQSIRTPLVRSTSPVWLSLDDVGSDEG
jgi:Rrf2 family protein